LHGGPTSALRAGVVGREHRNGVSIFRAAGTTFPTDRLTGRVSNYLTYFGSACVAGFMVPAPDVVVALTDPPIIGLAGVMTAVLARAKFVFLCEDVFPEVASLLEDFHSSAVTGALERVSRYLVRRADRIVALGDRMRERLIADKHADPTKITIIHNWADCSQVRPVERHNAFAREEGLADKFVVMHSGNVGHSQNLETLVAAADRLRDYTDIVMTIVGHGARLPALQATVRVRGLDNVRFLPQQPKERLSDLFGSADVFFVSLKQGIEGYIVPSKLYGILAAGRACIVAADRSAEPAAIVEAHDCGLTSEPGDPESLAAQILTLYRDRPRLARMAANARTAALQFDRPRQVDAYYRMLAEVTGSSC
jgi:glycosyltransferase involved in cell wall biosynthesis